jgi:hypothetical protein
MASARPQLSDGARSAEVVDFQNGWAPERAARCLPIANHVIDNLPTEFGDPSPVSDPTSISQRLPVQADSMVSVEVSRVALLDGA